MFRRCGGGGVTVERERGVVALPPVPTVLCRSTTYMPYIHAIRQAKHMFNNNTDDTPSYTHTTAHTLQTNQTQFVQQSDSTNIIINF